MTDAIDFGGLLGIEPEKWSAIMAQSGISPTDKVDIRKQQALMAGFALLGGRKGQELDAISRAGMGAVAYGQRATQDMLANKQQATQNALMLAKFQQAQQAQQAAQAQAQELSGAFNGGPNLGAMAPGGPTPANAAAIAPRPMIEQYRSASVIMAKNGNSEAAKRYADIANQLEAEYSTTPQTMKDASGNLASVLIGKRGETKKLDYTPAEKLHFADTGGMTGVGINPYTGKAESQGLPKSVDPNTQFTGNITMRGQNMTDARAREANTAAGPIIETAQGYARVGKDNTVTPIVAGGAQLQPKPTGAVTQQIAQNQVTLSKIDRALTLVDKTPEAFGVKNFAGDLAMQRFQPSGVEARAMVADIAGQKIHDRSGAAVTVGEAERLKPYVPNVTDTAAVVKKKLGMFRQEYRAMQEELAGGKSIAAAASGNTGGVTGGWSITERK